MEHVQDSITVRDHICQVFSESRTDPNEALIPLAEVIGNTIGKPWLLNHAVACPVIAVLVIVHEKIGPNTIIRFFLVPNH